MITLPSHSSLFPVCACAEFNFDDPARSRRYTVEHARGRMTHTCCCCTCSACTWTWWPRPASRAAGKPTRCCQLRLSRRRALPHRRASAHSGNVAVANTRAGWLAVVVVVAVTCALLGNGSGEWGTGAAQGEGRPLVLVPMVPMVLVAQEGLALPEGVGQAGARLASF